MTGTGEAVLFWILGPLAVMGALGLVFARKAVHAALGMVLTMIILGVIYITQGAPFLGIIQIFVYTGAVMMLFLFVLMLIGIDSADSVVETLKGQRFATVVLSLGLAALLFGAVGGVVWHNTQGPARLAATNADPGNVTAVAELIFGRYVWAFELTAALMITAALGAMVLAHRERIGEKLTQRDLSKKRIRSTHAAGLPAPGVYARHNAVDTPALLPDGSISELSISRVLRARDQVRDPEAYQHGELGVADDIDDARLHDDSGTRYTEIEEGGR